MSAVAMVFERLVALTARFRHSFLCLTTRDCASGPQGSLSLELSHRFAGPLGIFAW